ncbi:LTA synthase family protein [Chitinophaga alhagiae]|uniref:LTA synthase family protein n=1 Tax=Chitinophaga alhagiae TaxID=2203219 RepID=UPI00130098FF|nr:LTA synthase family protein [Chitinophaga alhagiae]
MQTLYLFCFLVVFRLIFFLFFFSSTIKEPGIIARAWYLGLKFDMRLALIIMIPVGLVAIIARDRLFGTGALRRLNFWYFFVAYLVLTLFYVVDLGHYSYLGLRLEPSVTRFLASGERATNARMMWESYPVVWGGLGILLLMAFVRFSYRSIYRRYAGKEGRPVRPWGYAGWVILLVLLFGAGIYGNFAWFPLRWSQAMFTRDNAVTSLALNPVLHFVSNMDLQADTFDETATRKYYPHMAEYLGVDSPNAQTLHFARSFPGDSSKPRQNVIIVMLESVGASMTSMFGNPMQATPNLQRLADNGALYKNFYVPAMSTARTVFGVTTGLPDVVKVKTASRHPAIVDQRVVMDQFKGYEKYYLLGGNTNWANIRAVFTNNVEGLQIFEEGYFKAPKADVWGVADYDLITEADEIFKKAHDSKKPFLAFLQTADNHEPYTTTSGAGDFKRLTAKEIDMKQLKASGFVNIDQFNALRYLDYNVGHLMQLAERSGYLNNTIFVFFGDHSARLDAYSFMPYPEFEMATYVTHVPCIIYNPKTVAPRQVEAAGSLLDVYPTVAEMTGMPYTNYTLGKSLLDTAGAARRFAFIQYVRGLNGYWATVNGQYLYEIDAKTGAAGLYDLRADAQKNVQQQNPELSRQMDNLTRGFYESARYLMFNNKKQ